MTATLGADIIRASDGSGPVEFPDGIITGNLNGGDISGSVATDADVAASIAAHNALATAHGLTANIYAALGAMLNPSAGNAPVMHTDAGIVSLARSGNYAALDFPTSVSPYHYRIIQSNGVDADDQCLFIGYNVASGGMQDVVGEPAFWFGMESRWVYNEDFELNFENVTAAGVNHRTLAYSNDRATMHTPRWTYEATTFTVNQPVTAANYFQIDNTNNYVRMTGKLGAGMTEPTRLTEAIVMLNNDWLAALRANQTETWKIIGIGTDDLIAIDPGGRGVKFGGGAFSEIVDYNVVGDYVPTMKLSRTSGSTYTTKAWSLAVGTVGELIFQEVGAADRMYIYPGGGPVTPNAIYWSGRDAGNANNIRAIGINASDYVHIAPSGTRTLIGGGAVDQYIDIACTGDHFQFVQYIRTGASSYTNRTWLTGLSTDGTWIIQDTTGGANRLVIGTDGCFRIQSSLGVGNTAVNTNTPSGATARQWPVYDAAGTLLGYVPIYAAAW